MDNILNIFGMIISLIGVLMLMWTFGYGIFFIFGKIGVVVYISILMIIIGFNLSLI